MAAFEFVPYISAVFDDSGLILVDNFSISFEDPDEFSDLFNGVGTYVLDSDAEVQEQYVTFDPGVLGAGIVPSYRVAHDDYSADYVVPDYLEDSAVAIDDPKFSNFEEGAALSSDEVYTGLLFNYNTQLDMSYQTISGEEKEDETSILKEKYQFYGNGFEYQSFSKAFEGITNNLFKEVYDLTNESKPTLLFKKTTQKQINLNSLAILTSSATQSTQTITTTTTTAGGSSYSGGGTSGGGGGY